MTDSLIDLNWVNQLSRYQTLWVGLSGGLDSCVLLHCLSHHPQLANQLSAIHIHHGLSVHADAWLKHCQALCAALGVPMVVRHVAFDKRANIEEGARLARYHAFADIIAKNDGLLLAHHADDQAETLLLQLLRGAGVDGMAAMPTVKPLGLGELVRPFLQHTRHSLEAYARRHQLTWVDDESNENLSFSRNYLRHQVMPLLRSRWPGSVASLVRSTQHCQQAKANLHALALLDCASTALNKPTLSLIELQTDDTSRIINVLRHWLMSNHVLCPSTSTFNRLVTEVIDAPIDATPCVVWGEFCVRRYQHTLYLLLNKPIPRLTPIDWCSFPSIVLLDDGAHLSASPANEGIYVPNGNRVQVRYRQGGELFSWHGQTKTLKTLLQQWHIPPWERDKLPLIYINDELAAVVGFAVSDKYYAAGLTDIYRIELHTESICLNH